MTGRLIVVSIVTIIGVTKGISTEPATGVATTTVVAVTVTRVVILY